MTATQQPPSRLTTPPSLLKRRRKILLQGILPLFMLIHTCFYFAPVELYYTNMEQFWFTLEDVKGIFWKQTIKNFAMLYGGYVLLACGFPVGASLYLSIFFLMGLGFYLQGNLLALDFGVMDGTSIVWEEYHLWGLLHTVILSGVMIYGVKTHISSQKRTRSLRQLASLYLLVIQSITLGVLHYTNPPMGKEYAVLSTDYNLFSLSGEGDVLVFVLDTLDVYFMEELLEVYPEVKTQFKDFTFYDNVLGAYPMSRESMPFLYTGIPYVNDQDYVDYKATSYEESFLLEQLRRYGYDISIYSENQYIHPNITDYTTNNIALYLELSQEREEEFLHTYYQMVQFRYAPYLLKESYWFSSLDFYQYIDQEEVTSSPYLYDNLSFYNQLKTEGLTLGESQRQYKFHYLMGPHLPLITNEYMEPVPESETSQVQQTKGCFLMMLEYLNQLRKLGIYDQTTIVILSDHGYSYSSGEEVDYTTLRHRPTVLIKEPYGNHSTMATSSAPLSYLSDWENTICSLINPMGFYGDSFLSVPEDAQRSRTFYASTELSNWWSPNSPTLNIIETDKQYTIDITMEDWTGEVLEMVEGGHQYQREEKLQALAEAEAEAEAKAEAKEEQEKLEKLEEQAKLEEEKQEKQEEQAKQDQDKTEAEE